ncbi:MAG: cyclodeaminase/cyclohydrolase family protein [Lachnospiraceae bacterium]|nr:cyclodeaminase/cyclohydrolase family protein [Lachnospiraceae bacterium]
MFEDRTLDEYTEMIASNAPVPGGGGASAVVGAIGIALGDMVGELTVGKKKYADVEEDIKALMVRAQELREKFLMASEKDAVVFEPLSRAYGIPKDEPGRDEILEKCLREAASAPLEIFDLSCEAIEIIKEFGEKGSRLMISDAATGAAHLKAAMYGAAVNVKVNTRLMKDREYAGKIDAHVEEMMDRYGKLADKVFEDIWQRF